MEINYFDLVAAVIILLLGLKGIVNGFFKEIFGLIGIIGGIFVASRIGESVGEELNALIFNFSSPAAISFLGFLTTLAFFWLLMVALGFVFKKLSSLSGLGPVDKILGFVFGASKFFLIAAVIAHAAYSIKAIKSTIDSNMSSSILFPIMVETGSYIMKMDPVGISEDINKTIDKSTEVIKEKTKDVVNDATKEKIQEIEKKLKEK
jgi:membrane protein required for colicin V production